MPLILGQSDALWYPVKGSMVAEDGARAPYEFQIQIPRMSREEISTMALLGTDAQIVTEKLKDWKGIVDADGKDVPFSPANVAAVIAVCPVAADIVAAIYEAHSPEGRRKN